MATDEWKTGTSGGWDIGSSWTGGVPPAPGDTAIISSAGGPAPMTGANAILESAAGDSVANLTTNPVVEPNFIVTDFAGDPTQKFIYYPDTPAGSQAIHGNAVDNTTIDVLGSGSVAVLYLQNTDLGSNTVANVSGSALLFDRFDSQLNGTINVGLPFSIDGSAASPPAANPNGFANELDLFVDPAGSWTYANGGYTYPGYVPAPVNNATINVARASAFRVQLFGAPQGQNLIPTGPPLNGYDLYVTPAQISQFTNDGTIDVQPGGTVDFYDQTSDGDHSLYGDQVTNNGLIELTGGAGQTTSFFSSAPLVGGTLAVNGGTATDPSATIAELDNSTTDLTATIADATLRLDIRNSITRGSDPNQFTGGAIRFADDKAVLDITQSNQDLDVTVGGSDLGPVELDSITGNYATPIEGFSVGDKIAMSFAFSYGSKIISEGTYSFAPIWDPSTNTLAIEETVVPDAINASDGTQSTIIADLKLVGSYDASGFHVTWSPDPYYQYSIPNVVTVTLTTTANNQGAPCFVAGTRIATPDGEVPVETLRAGDFVLTLEGGLTRPAVVRWVGHRRVDCAAHAEHAPVRIAAGALGPATPGRDLLVSPDHALLLDGMLVPAEALIDGETILHDRDAAGCLTYHHVELERHAILLAEGAPAESYLDTGNRARFANCPLRYDPIEAAANDPCADMLFAGARLAPILSRLRSLRMTADHRDRAARAALPSVQVEGELQHLPA